MVGVLLCNEHYRVMGLMLLRGDSFVAGMGGFSFGFDGSHGGLFGM